MPRSPSTALGKIATPFGDVLVRIETDWRSGRPGFSVRGATSALRWLFPHKTIAGGRDRLFLLPPKSEITTDRLAELFREMGDLAAKRFAEKTHDSSRKSTLGDMLNLLRVEARSLRASTFVTYEHEWKGVLSHFPADTLLTDISREDVQEMIADKIEEGLAPATIRKHFVHLKRMLNRALDEDLIGKNPCVKVRLPRRITREVRFLLEDERMRLLAAARADGPDALLLIANGVYLGYRKAELLSLDWRKTYDFQKRVARVRNQEHFTSKNGLERTIPMCEEFIEIALPFYRPSGLVLRPDKPYIQGKRYRWDIRAVLNRCCAAAGIEPIHPHVMRHTFASIAAQRGVSLYKIGKWMGHTLDEVTAMYAHLCAYDDEINKLNGGAAAAPQRPHLRIVE